jgi:hypothetical protein
VVSVAAFSRSAATADEALEEEEEEDTASSSSFLARRSSRSCRSLCLLARFLSRSWRSACFLSSRSFSFRASSVRSHVCALRATACEPTSPHTHTHT